MWNLPCYGHSRTYRNAKSTFALRGAIHLIFYCAVEEAYQNRKLAGNPYPRRDPQLACVEHPTKPVPADGAEIAKHRAAVHSTRNRLTAKAPVAPQGAQEPFRHNHNAHSQ